MDSRSGMDTHRPSGAPLWAPLNDARGTDSEGLFTGGQPRLGRGGGFTCKSAKKQTGRKTNSKLMTKLPGLATLTGSHSQTRPRRRHVRKVLAFGENKCNVDMYYLDPILRCSIHDICMPSTALWPHTISPHKTPRTHVRHARRGRSRPEINSTTGRRET